MTSIDLNADLGEGMGHDDDLLRIVSSASIACGGHAGDAATIRHILKICKARGVRAGAHPGYVDRKGFGRFRVAMPLEQLLGQIRSQLFLVRHIAGEVDVPLDYVKLHGALANQAAEELEFAVGIFASIHAMDPKMAVLALDNSEQVKAAKAVGLPLIREAYADRAYNADGLLVPRAEAGAVIDDVDAVIDRCLRLARHGEILAIDGSVLKSAARSICLHGDTPGAVDLAREIRDALEGEGITIAPAAAETETSPG
ncbi:5-oxoprolinase subunit PxpA [Devosia sp. YIM 151766]|uniref:LamB/YcsF family protein n=1 Tax=Devosia sp. YIM 151766 TaxID=3017325 RepID=UPI00255CD596|nr:5-oxoprolinase subunit PxpA [Devosia sp. YIM 151766]WIY54266.1 5-oxoprolinase subunit PxpA [Devosia sp. YIM 151766]